MEITYEEGTLLWYWYEDWIVVGGFAVALVVAAWVTARSGWGAGGLLIKGLMAAEVLAALPLTLVRLAVDIDVSDDSTLGYLSLAGAIGSLVIGLPYLVISWPLKDETWAERITPAYKTAAGVCAYYHRSLRDYISSARLAMSLFAGLPQRHLAPATWESTSRNARSTIVARASSEISIARQDMAEAEAYFNPTTWAHSERP